MKLPGVNLTDLEYEELAELISQRGNIVAAIKSRDVSIAEKIAIRAWFLHQAVLEREKPDELSDLSIG